MWLTQKNNVHSKLKTGCPKNTQTPHWLTLNTVNIFTPLRINYGGRKVAICFSGIRKADKQILWLIYMSFSPFLLFCYQKSRLKVFRPPTAYVKYDFPVSERRKGDGHFSAAQVKSVFQVAEKQRNRKLHFHKTLNLLFYYSGSRKANDHFSAASIRRKSKTCFSGNRKVEK